MQLLPGVEARNDFSTGFNVRGGESDQNLILIDGYPIYNPFHLGGLFSTFIDPTVGDVTLMTGGFPARYGGRLSSVLDVTSAEPERAGRARDAKSPCWRRPASLGERSTRGKARGRSRAGARTPTSSSPAISEQTFRITSRDEQAHGVRVQLGAQSARSPRYAGADALDANIAQFGDSATDATGGGVQVRLGEPSRRDAARCLARSARLPLLGVGDSATPEQRVVVHAFRDEPRPRRGAFSLTCNSVSELRRRQRALASHGAHERSARIRGVGLRDSLRRRPPSADAPLLRARASIHGGRVYYQETWKPTRKLIAESGVRAEHLSGRDWSALSPRVSAKYFVTPDLALSAAAGEYAQWLHSLNREDIPVRIFDFWVASDEYVPVSKARHYVLGIERWLGPLRFARVEGWVKQYDHLLEQNTADDPAVRGDEFLDSRGRRMDSTCFSANSTSDRSAVGSRTRTA